MIVKMPEYLYEDCTVERWVDGDTVDLTVRQRFDMGFKVVISGEYTGRFRLMHVDAWERNEPRGPEATEFVNRYMPPGEDVCIRTRKDPDSFGRYLADIWLPAIPEHTVSACLLKFGLATPYVGRIK